MIKRRFDCRVCKGTNLIKLWDFGMTPLANDYVSEENLDKQEVFYPLQVNQCLSCGSMQLAHVVDPNLLFKQYLFLLYETLI